MNHQRIIIVGGVAAGPKAASRARRRAPAAEITIIDRAHKVVHAVRLATASGSGGHPTNWY